MDLSLSDLVTSDPLTEDAIATEIERLHSSAKQVYHSVGSSSLIKVTSAASTETAESLKELCLQYGSGAAEIDSQAPQAHLLKFAEEIRKAVVSTSTSSSSSGSAQVVMMRGSAGSGKSEALKQMVNYYTALDSLPSLLSLPAITTTALSPPLGTAKNPFLLHNDSSLISRRLCASMALFQAFGVVHTSPTAATWSSIPRIMQHICLRFHPSTGKLTGSRVQACLFPEIGLRCSLKDSVLFFQAILAASSPTLAPITPDGLTQLPPSVKEHLLETVTSSLPLSIDELRQEAVYLQDLLVRQAGLTPDDWQVCVRIVYAITLLQSITILGGETTVLSTNTKGYVNNVEDILGLESGSLNLALTKRPDERIGRAAGSMIDCKPAETRVIIDSVVSELVRRLLSHYLDLLASRGGGGGETVINPIDYSENVYLDGGIVHLLDSIGYQSNRSSLPGPLSYSLLSTLLHA